METNMNTREAAKYLKEKGTPFKRGTLEVWRSQGRGPAYKKIGRSIFYTQNALDSFVQGETVSTVDSMEDK